MSKLYLHKYKKEYLKTTKNTIIADIDKLNDDYKYEKGISKKEPKELIITGKINEDFTFGTNIFGLPVEKVIIDCNIHSHYTSLKVFEKAKELEIIDNVKKIEIFGNYGLKNIENITIPFNIQNFDNNYIYVNNIKTITIKHNELIHIIELDEVFNEKQIDISITNSNNILDINIRSKFSSVNHKVYLENNEIKSIKKYNKYEIIPNETDTLLDLVELRKKIDAKFTSNSFLNYESMIVSKKDYDFLTNMTIGKGKLKEIIIKDDNDMTLFPRNVHIKIDKDKLKLIELYNNKLTINIEKEDKTDKFILINDDLSYVECEINNLTSIRKIYLDFNTTKFNSTYENDFYNITIPFDNNSNIKNSKIITNLILSANEIYVKTKENEILIPKSESSYNGFIRDIERENDNFCVMYYEYVNGEKMYKDENYILYTYDQNKDAYVDSYKNYYFDTKKTKKLTKK